MVGSHHDDRGGGEADVVVLELAEDLSALAMSVRSKAASLYHRILELDPDNRQAREGLARIAGEDSGQNGGD